MQCTCSCHIEHLKQACYPRHDLCLYHSRTRACMYMCMQGYVYTTARLNSTWVEICCVFTRGGLESSTKNSISRFPTTRIIFWKRILQSTRRVFFNPGWTVYMHFSAFFNAGWNLNPASRPGLRFNPGCHVNARLLLRAYWVESQPGLKLVM